MKTDSEAIRSAFNDDAMILGSSSGAGNCGRFPLKQFGSFASTYHGVLMPCLCLACAAAR